MLKSAAGKMKVAASFWENFSILNEPGTLFRINVPPKCSLSIVQVISTLSPQFTIEPGFRVS